MHMVETETSTSQVNSYREPGKTRSLPATPEPAGCSGVLRTEGRGAERELRASRALHAGACPALNTCPSPTWSRRDAERSLLLHNTHLRERSPPTLPLWSAKRTR